jgi:hypothetical protein
MKYFTPELLLRFRSEDDDIADAASEEWERAIARYRRRFRKLRPSLPESVRKFHDEYCLHDAEVCAPARLPGGQQDVIIVTQNLDTLFPEHLNTLITLQYAVAEAPVIERCPEADAFYQRHPIWLYDEFDVIEPGVFSHEILISTGRVIKIRFRDFRYQVAPIVGRIRDSGVKGVSEGERAAST